MAMGPLPRDTLLRRQWHVHTIFDFELVSSTIRSRNCRIVHSMAAKETGEATLHPSPKQEEGIQYGERHNPDLAVGLLTGGDDRSYALGLALSLVAEGVLVEFIGSDKLDAPELHSSPRLHFFNLRGDQREDASLGRKVLRLSAYYVRLVRYTVIAKPRIFHILWNNKFELLDRTVLMLYYRLFGRKVILTAHNVNAAKRDGRDSAINRLSLRIQYRLSNHIFVHTEKMRDDLRTEFAVPAYKVSVIPFGINNTSPNSSLSTQEARRRLGIAMHERTLLFFGQIAPYKGLEYLVSAVSDLMRDDIGFRLVIAGKVKKGHESYWRTIENQLVRDGLCPHVVTRIEYIPDCDVEIYFKAADVLVIPYVDIFQSGVPFLAYSFGLPVIATDVGSLKQDVLHGKTGLICKPRDPDDLAKTVREFFSGGLYQNLAETRSAIQRFANERNSWTKTATITRSVYQSLLST